MSRTTDTWRPSLLRLSAANAGEVLTLQRAAYATEAQIYDDPFLPPLTQTLEELEFELAGPAGGAFYGSRLVGSVRWKIDNNTCHIARIAVAPDLQGRGIGTTLLRAAEAASGSSTFELFTGHLSSANIRLYEREGYLAHRRELLRPGVDLVHFRKVVTRPAELPRLDQFST